MKELLTTSEIGPYSILPVPLYHQRIFAYLQDLDFLMEFHPLRTDYTANGQELIGVLSVFQMSMACLVRIKKLALHHSVEDLLLVAFGSV